MIRSLRLLLTLVGLCVLSGFGAQARAQAQEEDVVYLRDGSVIRGTIIEQRPGISIRIRTRDGSIFNFAMDRVERMTKEPVFGQAAPSSAAASQSSSAGRKEPALSFVLSLLLTGAGQGYNGQWGKAGLMFTTNVAGAVMLVVGSDESYGCDSFGCYYDDGPSTLAYVGLGVMLASKVWSLIDAPVSASAINRRVSQRAGLHVVPSLTVHRLGGPGTGYTNTEAHVGLLRLTF